MEEIWKDIIVSGEDFSGYYQVSNKGRIKSVARQYIDTRSRKYNKPERILNPLIVGGYYAVWLYKPGIKRRYMVHCLVAEAFISNPEGLPQVSHKDENNLLTGDGCNNNVENLKWATAQENSNMPMRKTKLSGENNYFYGKHFKGELHPQYGTHRSEATKQKISQKLKEKHIKPAGSKKIICENKIYDTIQEFADFIGYRQNTVSRWLSGKRTMPQEWAEKGLSYYEKE